MNITAELLREKIKELSAQRDNALAVHQQATGALILAEHLLELFHKEPATDQMTLQEFAETMGGVSAEIVENHSNG
jgi:hypothetical protein